MSAPGTSMPAAYPIGPGGPGVCRFRGRSAGVLLAALSALVLIAGLGVGRACAHDTPMAVLSLTEQSPGVYALRWNQAAARGGTTPEAVFPAHCLLDLGVLDCGPRGLTGRVSVAGLGEMHWAVVVRIAPLDGEPQSYALTAARPAALVDADGVLPLSQVAGAYLPLGIEHILLGVDHLLFVLGLLLLVRSRWMLVQTITAFTVAHSLTLAAATLGFTGVPERPVNAAIALSILIVAAEVLKHRRGESCLGARFPWAVAFGFGLLHGFGFAGALSAIALPAASLPAALLSFNLGVEIGQLAFVFLVLALAWSHRLLDAELPRWAGTGAVYAMGSIAGLWTLSRVLILLTPSGPA